QQPSEELMRLRPGWPYMEAPGRAQAHLFLAMAHHRLGHAEEARRALAEADRILAEVPNQPDPVTLQRAWRWRERILAEVLRREAGELLGVPAAPVPGVPGAAPTINSRVPKSGTQDPGS